MKALKIRKDVPNRQKMFSSNKLTAGYKKINMTISVAFLHINNRRQTKKEIREKIPFTIASKPT